MIPRNDSKTSDWSFRQWLHQMLHTIATQLEHYRPVNNSGITLPAGTIVYPSNDDKMGQAISDNIAVEKSRWIGVLEVNTLTNRRGTIKNAGYVKVLLVDDLSPIAGDDIFISETAGKGTIDDMLDPSVFVGVVGDASEYDGDSTSETYNPYVHIYIRSMCGKNLRR